MARRQPTTGRVGVPLRALLEARRDEIKAIVTQHRGQRVRVFGSVARGEDRTGSDIDLLVDFEPDSSLFDLRHLSEALSDLLEHPVDVVSAGGLKPRDRTILDEAIEL
ncbi:MAG TPA: nucleotidyltransferase domain-containing protein [Acidimicrobiales bacterium]